MPIVLQVGHQAVECPNGTVNWKAIYGEDAFMLRPPIYESQLRERRKLKQVDEADLVKRAEQFAKVSTSNLCHSQQCTCWVALQTTAASSQALARAFAVNNNNCERSGPWCE